MLDHFARNSELGLGAQLWLVRGTTAREAVSSGGEEGVDKRLETLQHDSEMGIASISRTAGEVYADLLELGSAFVPALTSAGEGGPLAERGYGVLIGDTLAGFLDGKEAKGLELLAGGPSADILVGGEGRVSAKVTSAHTASALEFQGGVPSVLKLHCQVTVRLVEYRRRPEGRELEALRQELEGQELARLTAAVDRLQSLGADCAGLGAKAGIAHPARWQAVRGRWPEWFSQVPVEIQVEVKIL